MDVATGYYYSCAIDADGELDCWGELRDYADNYTPSGHYAQISIGYGTACAVELSGDITCWGIDPHGEVSNIPERYGGSSE